MDSAGAARLAFVDSMRLFAALLVLLQHIFEGRSGFAQSYLIPLAPGVAGVAIFFFISGYVIPMATKHGFAWRAFMIRRLFRIYPLYLVALLLLVVAGGLQLLPQLSYVTTASMRTWAANVLLIAEYVGVRPFLGVSWTLAVELVWYALFAASIIAFGKRAADRLDVVIPVSFVALALLSLAIETRIPLGRPTMIYAAVLGFQCYRFHGGEITARRLMQSIATFALVALFGNFVAFGIFNHPNLTLAQAIGPWIFATAVFLTWVLYRPLRELKPFNHGVLPALGAMSYSIYLLHPFATAAADRYVATFLQVPTTIVATFALAWLGFNFVEKPGIKLGRTLTHGWSRPFGKARLT